MIPAGCAWVSTANATAPCAGYVSCPTGTKTPGNSGSAATEFNYFNLTGSGHINASTNELDYFDLVNNVSSVTVSINRTSAAPGDYVLLNVTFHGTFDWNSGSQAAIYYLNSNVINIHYFGVELRNQTGQLLDQNNGPWYNYIRQIGEPHQYLAQNQNASLPLHWVITPTGNAANKTLKLCGGYFAAYGNTTIGGGWGEAYDNLSMRQQRILNLSAINIPSQNCEYLKVT